ncbi:outer membrane insertion C-terminal signal [Methylobacterium sp. 174MFSha1.1]|uniref:outer membrane protein n=1 Tax=Methylobacterium sp. 174MFSha1.1 TaxID=1502749 RepID=UPI0008E8A923|nr:outer membrane beta-barrel protein [Methylobacterium sp. 174MFSha1.1]SFV13221.1 outer membrane insertion C-terminal signal [Methylobacterium sp. 174MFSha1.1]
MRFASFGFLVGSVLVSLSVAATTTVRAADLDFGALRGGEFEPAAAPVVDVWDGIYVGGHGGWSSASFGFGNVFQSTVAQALRATAIESTLSASTLLHARDVRRDGTTFGAYAGVNYQFDETVVGVEVDYTHSGLRGRSSDAIGREIVDSKGYLRGADLSGDATTQIKDYATIRARVGYTVAGFMPFVTGGFAIGRAQIAETVAVRGYEYDQSAYRSNQALTPPAKSVYVGNSGYANFRQDDPGGSVLAPPDIFTPSKEKIVGGIAAGAGLEYAITPNLLLRAEYQYILFNDFDGHKLNVNTVRGGAAVKF